MSKYNLPITLDEIREFKDNLCIGQILNVKKSNAMWDKTKRKKKVVVVEKYKFHVVCRYLTSGIYESFTYVQMILGEGPWLA